jgi:hypothetical protein
LLSPLVLAPAVGGGCQRPVSVPPSELRPEASGTTGTPAAAASSTESGAIQLTDVSNSSGIAFKHTDGASGRKYLVEPMSAGLALFDYDGDGLIDIYFANGAPLPPLPPDPRTTSALYRNEGSFRFREVTQAAGVGSTQFGLGVVAGDYDGDGDPDLYLSNLGPNVLYRNNGDGTFTDVTQTAGVGRGDRMGAGAVFLDADGDGDLDLLAANYTVFSLEKNPQRSEDGFPIYPGPLDFEPETNVFFLNNGDGTFSDASDAAGIAQCAGTGMGAIAADYDNDRDSDLFVANDVMGSFLFENDGTGKFSEVGVVRGFAYGYDGRARGNMGVDCADYDHDGWLDLFVTTFINETCVLFRNSRGRFEDATAASGAGSGSVRQVKWGTGFADFDGDGHRDLFIACGHLDQEVHRWVPGARYREPNLLLRNNGGKFEEVSTRCGDGLAPAHSSRGTGLDDLDNDGDVDLVILNSADQPTIVRNDTRLPHHWLEVELRGRQSNRDGVGAQVRVTAGGRTQLDEVHAGRGYQSHHGTRLHFGLGSAQEVERIEVRWIGGGTDVLEGVAADQVLLIREGSDKAVTLGR